MNWTSTDAARRRVVVAGLIAGPAVLLASNAFIVLDAPGGMRAEFDAMAAQPWLLLVQSVLEALGFTIERHIARVVLTSPRDASPRTHMFVVVSLDGARHVADPGFGALAARVPVPLVEGRRVASGHDVHWMARDGDGWKLCTLSDGKPIDCWVTALDTVPTVDFIVANHYTSTHPASSFVNRLMMRAVTDDGRVALMNRDVTIRRDGTIERRELRDRHELRALVAAHFGFDLPDIERLAVPSVPGWT
jgi:N-hydroxyarylamine O-acetyltransferase